jgi:plastocyanin
MRTTIAEPGIKWVWLFLVLFLFSCHSTNNKVVEKKYHSDTVTIHQMQFDPAILTINKGDTVVWINKDMVDHNVTEEKNKTFYSDTISIGKSWKHSFDSSANYFCSIHPSMKGKVIVH